MENGKGEGGASQRVQQSQDAATDKPPAPPKAAPACALGIKAAARTPTPTVAARACWIPNCELESLARRLEPFGWHVELLVHVQGKRLVTAALFSG